MWIWSGNVRRCPRSVPLRPLVVVPVVAGAIVGIGALVVNLIGRLL